MARPLNNAEKQRFQSLFPGLDVNQAVVTGEASPVYNCISWTVGLADRWLWPGPSLGHFDVFYRGFGYVRSGDGPIAAWGNSQTDMTHGCVSGQGHGPRWESKCGGDLRIQHGLNELTGSSYGRIVAFYRQSLLIEAVFANLTEKMMATTSKPVISASQKKSLRELRAAVSVERRKAFATAFDAWKQTWFSGGLAVNSNPHARTVGKEFDALVALGPEILPLVVAELVEPENFMALQLYDAIQPDQRQIVQFGPDDERILEGEQGRAFRVVQAWLANR